MIGAERQTLRIFLLGQPRFDAHGEPHKFSAPPKTLPLLAYLLLHRSRPVNRDKLAFTLWEDDAEDDARTNLRRHLYHLQHALPAPPADRPWLIADGESVQWNPAADCWLDVADFERLAASPDERERAAELYAGDLVEPLYDEWLYAERDRLRNLYLATLGALVMEYRGRRDFAAAASSAQRLLATDPWREDMLRQLMAVRYEAGDRAGALQSYDRFSDLLRKEMDVDPMPETASLRDVILRNGSLPDSAAPRNESEPAADRPAMPFAGRENELEQLRALWSRAARGHGTVAFVGGEAGIGKTRLVTELALRAGTEGARVIMGGTSTPENNPYQAIVEALRAALPLVAALEVDPIWLAALSQVMPDVRARRPDLPSLPPVDPGREQSRLFEALGVTIEGLSKPRPLLLILEDVHWAGSATLDAIELIARRAAHHAVMLVATYRDEEAPRSHPLRDVFRRLRQSKLATSIGLGRLSVDAVERIVRQSPAAVEAGEDTMAAARRLHAESEGNPLFLSEVIREKSESPGQSPAAPVAGGVRPTIAARVSRLSSEARTLGEIAAVIGRGFDVELARDVSGWTEEQLLAPLEELLDRSIIRESAGRNRFDYAFTHHLIQSTIYDSIPSASRQRRHHRVARVLEDSGAGDAPERAAELARHFDVGGAAERAARWYARAAEYAYAVHANREAIDLAARGAALTSDPDVKCVLLGVQEAALSLVGDRAAQQPVLDQLLRYADATGNPDLLNDALRRRIRLCRLLGERDAERGAIADLLQRADDARSNRWKAIGLLERGSHQEFEGRYEEACRDLEVAVSVFAAIQDAEGEVDCLCLLARIAAHRERVPEMQAIIDRAMSVANNAGPNIAGKLIDVRLRAAAARNDFREQREAALQQLEISHAVGDREGEAIGHKGLANAASGLLDVAAARRHFDASLAIYRALNDRTGEATVLHDSGVFAVALSRLDDAWEAFSRAEELFAPMRNLRGMAYCALNMSWLSHQRDDYEACMATAGRALELARAMKNRGLESAALMNLGSAEARLGRFADGVRHAEESIALQRVNEQPGELVAYVAEMGYTYAVAGNIASAVAAADESLALHETNDKNVRFPESICWIAAQIYRAGKKFKRANELLDRAVGSVKERAAAIPDDESREAFMAMRDHRDILLAREKNVWPKLGAVRI
jgi:DNA-binding SARP family transcriptional activator